LSDCADRFDVRPYLLFGNEVHTYADAERLANELAAGLEGAGIGAGDHVAIMMENCPQYLWLIFALGKLGAVGVPINNAAKGALLGYYLEDADCVSAVVDGAYADGLRGAAAEKGVALRSVIVRGEGASQPVDYDLDALFVAGAGANVPKATVSFSDPWLIMYTSGTTGPSKGCVCPHAHPQTVGYRVAANFDLGPDDVLYTCLPLFHGNALWYSALAALWAGGSIALAPRFSASRFWSDIRRYRCTVFSAIMSVATILEKADPVSEERDNSLRLAFVVPLPRERVQLEKRWGLKFVCNYSMTEIFPPYVLTPGAGYENPGTSGTTAAGIEARVVDEHDVEVAPGVVGEVVVRPDEPWTIFAEYYKKPQATAEAFRNLWFHTGDRARIDEDGHFHFADRVTDSIRRRGENISAHEIEEVISVDSRIREAAAVPAPSDLGEDDVAIYVVKADESVTEREIVEYARDNMAYYMVPRYVHFVDELPKTPTHKVAKYVLRERALSDYKRMWDREEHGIEVRRPTASS
jgi:crotonobetaine/carnitine-CoA ligase